MPQRHKRRVLRPRRQNILRRQFRYRESGAGMVWCMCAHAAEWQNLLSTCRTAAEADAGFFGSTCAQRHAYYTGTGTRCMLMMLMYVSVLVQNAAARWQHL